MKETAKLIALGVVLWIAVFLFLFATKLSGPLGSILGALFIFLLPILTISLVLYDLLRIIRDKDPFFWSKRWYKVLLVMGVISTIVSGFVLVVLPSPQPLSELWYIGPAFADEATAAHGVSQGARDFFISLFIVLVIITFFVSGYITFLKSPHGEETERTKQQTQYASDILKTIFGFIIGVLTGVFNR
jgi:hypothetical protein